MDDYLELFDIESKKLDDQISHIATISEPSTQKIVELYYQVINITSMITVLKQQITPDDNKTQFDKITQVENMISTKFNHDIHPQLVTKLTNSIEDTTKRLQHLSSDKQSLDDIQRDAKLYEDLREKMSTREFVVQQYQRSIS